MCLTDAGACGRCSVPCGHKPHASLKLIGALFVLNGALFVEATHVQRKAELIKVLFTVCCLVCGNMTQGG